jgi:predicted GIY-YIG superfamily endonuclease
VTQTATIIAIAAVVVIAVVLWLVRSRRTPDDHPPLGPTAEEPTPDPAGSPSATGSATRARLARQRAKDARGEIKVAGKTMAGAVGQTAMAMRDHVADQIVVGLTDKPLGALRSHTTVGGVRLSALGSAGFTNVAQVAAVSGERLQRIPGIGPASARQLKLAAGEVQSAVAATVTFGVSTSIDTPAQVRLLQALWVQVVSRPTDEVDDDDLLKLRESLLSERRALRLLRWRAAWWLATRRRTTTWLANLTTGEQRIDELLGSAAMVRCEQINAVRVTAEAATVDELWQWVNANRSHVSEAIDAAAAIIPINSSSRHGAKRAFPRFTATLAGALELRLRSVPVPPPGVLVVPSASSAVDDTTALYRLYDRAGVLLYVGISNDVHGRIRTHRMEKTWGPLIADSRIEFYATRVSALDAEATAIRRERPRFNVIHNG